MERLIIFWQQRQGQIVSMLFLFFITWYLLAWWGWLRYPFRGANAWEAIPSATALILEVNKLDDARQQFIQEPFGQSIAAVELLQMWQHDAEKLDELWSIDSSLSNLMETAHIVSCTQNNGAKEIAWLWILEDYAPTFDLNSWIKKAAPQEQQTSTYRGLQVHTLRFASGSQWSFCIYRGIILASRLPAAVEFAVAQLDDLNTNILRRGNFGSARNATKQGKLNIYLNFDGIPMLLSPLAESVGGQITALGKTATWAAMDITTDSSNTALQWQGNWLPKGRFFEQLSYTQPPTQTKIAEFLPEDIAVLAYMGNTDFNGFYDRYKTSENADFEHYFLPWIGNDVAYFCTEPGSPDFSESRFILLQSKDIQQTEKMLNLYGERFGVLQTIEYQGLKIQQIAAKDLMLPIFGDELNPLQNPYYVIVEDYAVFCNSLTNLELWIEKRNFGKHLGKVSAYQPLVAALQQSSLYVWINTRRAYPLLRSFLRENRIEQVATSWLHLKKTNPICLKANAQRGSFDLRLTALFDDSKAVANTNSANVAWRCELKNDAILPPIQVTSPYNSNESDIVIQDKDLFLYRLDFNGKIIWQQKLKSAILSSIHPIDFHSNGEWQYLFNTSEAIYIIDREGNELKNIPLIAPAVAGLSLLDYKMGERIIVSCSNGGVYGYDKNGKPWTGWNPLEGLGRVQLPFLAYEQKDKTFVWSASNGGAIRACRPDGLLHFDATYANESPNGIGIDTVIARVAVGVSSGKVWAVNTSGKSFSLAALPQLKPPVLFEYADVVADNRKDYIRCDGQKLMVHAYDSAQKFKSYYTYTFDKKQDEVFSTPLPGSTKRGVGTVSQKWQSIYLFDEQGNLWAGFPLVGTSRFWIADNFGNGNALLVVANRNMVYAYKVRR